METAINAPHLGQFVGAQFPTKLAKYAEDLNTQKKLFVDAMVMQIAVHVDEMRMCLTFSNIPLVERQDYKNRS